jgi:hypothetical protein
VNEPLWRTGLRELWKGLAESPSHSKNTIDIEFAPDGSIVEDPWSPAALKKKGNWLTGVTVTLFLCGIACWLIPFSDDSSQAMISGIFLKLGLFFAGVRLAWPQLCYLFQFKIGFAGVVLLMIAGIIFVVRPRAALVAWPLLVTLAGGLTFLGWLSQKLNQAASPRSNSKKRGRQH